MMRSCMTGLRQPGQTGVSLLLFTFVLLILGTTFFLSAWNGKQALQSRTLQREQSMQQAKEAVIGYAARNPPTPASTTPPGRLICPEKLSASDPIEGQAQSNCFSITPVIGRFPWKTLKTGRLTDDQGEPLWYVVSPGFDAAPINSNTPGQLQVDGMGNSAVALIIAPGSPLPGQNRSPPSATNPPQGADYLDLTNSTGPFVTDGPAGTFNDKVLVITSADLAKAVNLRILAEIRGLDTVGGLLRYHWENGQFPWADTNADGYGNAGQAIGALPYNDLSFDSTTKTWLNSNGWFPLVSYRRLSADSVQISIGSTSLKVVP